MGTGLTYKKFGGVLVFSVAVLCSASAKADKTSSDKSSSTQTNSTKPHTAHRKTAKKPPLPPLPSGPTGPVQQIPLDSIGAVAPQVSFQDNQLTINAPNSTLADILRAVRKQTGAEIEVPSAPERVVTHLGPGPARDVVAELLNGSRFNYVLLGSPENQSVLTRVVLVPKSGSEASSAISAAPDSQQTGDAAPADPEAGGEGQEAEANDESTDDGTDQTAEEQPATAPDQTGGVKTPQQMLQEMQQRQMQLQQQQPPGQPPVPGTGIAPGRPPQEQN